MISAWRALPLSFSSSAILALRRSSLCFCVAMTLTACSREPTMLVLSLGERLLELDRRIGAVVEVLVELRLHVSPPLLEEFEHAGELTGWFEGVVSLAEAIAQQLQLRCVEQCEHADVHGDANDRAGNDARHRAGSGVRADGCAPPARPPRP